MTGELLPFDRRMTILSILVNNKRVTRRSLAAAVSASYTTIGRDLCELSRYVPIYSKMGRHGGIYILDSYFGTKVYLSAEEEIFLNNILKNVVGDEQRIVTNILRKFSVPRT